MWFPFDPFWSVKHLNFGQKYQIGQSNILLLKVDTLRLLKINTIFCPPGLAKRYQLMDYDSKWKLLFRRNQVFCLKLLNFQRPFALVNIWHNFGIWHAIKAQWETKKCANNFFCFQFVAEKSANNTEKSGLLSCKNQESLVFRY